MNKTELIRCGHVNIVVTDDRATDGVEQWLHHCINLALTGLGGIPSLQALTSVVIHEAVTQSEGGELPHICDPFDPNEKLGFFEVEEQWAEGEHWCEIWWHRSDETRLLGRIDWPQ